MAGFKRSVIINKAIEEVFDFATNLDNASKFLPSVTKLEMLTEGGMKPGAKFKETRKGRSAVIEVVEHKRPEVHAASASMMGMHATYWFRFHAEPAGTRVEMKADVKGNFIWWLFLGAMSRMMEKEDGEYLERLKSAMQPTKDAKTTSLDRRSSEQRSTSSTILYQYSVDAVYGIEADIPPALSTLPRSGLLERCATANPAIVAVASNRKCAQYHQNHPLTGWVEVI